MSSAAEALEQLALHETSPGPLTEPTIVAALVYGLATPMRSCHLPIVNALQRLLRVDARISHHIVASSESLVHQTSPPPSGLPTPVLPSSLCRISRT